MPLWFMRMIVVVSSVKRLVRLRHGLSQFVRMLRLLNLALLTQVSVLCRWNQCLIVSLGCQPHLCWVFMLNSFWLFEPLWSQMLSSCGPWNTSSCRLKIVPWFWLINKAFGRMMSFVTTSPCCFSCAMKEHVLTRLSNSKDFSCWILCCLLVGPIMGIICAQPGDLLILRWFVTRSTFYLPAWLMDIGCRLCLPRMGKMWCSPRGMPLRTLMMSWTMWSRPCPKPWVLSKLLVWGISVCFSLPTGVGHWLWHICTTGFWDPCCQQPTMKLMWFMRVSAMSFCKLSGHAKLPKDPGFGEQVIKTMIGFSMSPECLPQSQLHPQGLVRACPLCKHVTLINVCPKKSASHCFVRKGRCGGTTRSGFIWLTWSTTSRMSATDLLPIFQDSWWLTPSCCARGIPSVKDCAWLGVDVTKWCQNKAST